MHTIKAVIFDMDGLIVDSEPYWKQAEKQVFTSLGCEVTVEDQLHTACLTTRAVTDYWYEKSPWSILTKQQAENAVVEEVNELLRKQCQAKPGFFDALEVCRSADAKVGLASNAPLRLCHTVVSSLSCQDVFECVLSAEMVSAGKPQPHIYHRALETLQVTGSHALALEDSPTGAMAARTAGMRVIGVPSEPRYRRPMQGLADKVLHSLDQFSLEHLR
ncbi:hexitol phosphatase HxpB [Thiomicrorhabdus sp. 6S3-12]|uniref:hexitol phosphatase HxpB n=1 Tax=Thiomicrorhabdus sp. 6S3-12 TaxID=2819681 RepID=UPI001AAD7D3F|nr:hexitol phosphatase HxpB [Thiomicrorhabdus sp. 6S3-12]MBO1924411.1 hexitol phosphatase HxpB [Thiomicrorhabdus sp. 6S3-12]